MSDQHSDTSDNFNSDDDLERELNAAEAAMGIPDGWVEGVFLPRGKYYVAEGAAGWHIYHEDDHGAYT